MKCLFQGFPMLRQGQGQVWQHAERFRRPRHFHPEPEIDLVVRGSAAFGVGSAEVEAEQGDLLCFTPGQDHVLLRSSPDLQFLAVGIAPSVLDRAALGGAQGAVLPVRTRLSREAAESVIPHALALAGRPADGGDVLFLWEIAHRCQRVAATSGALIHELTRRALYALSARPELSRSELAMLGRSCPSEIGRYFRRDVGITLIDFRTRMRLLRFIARVDSGTAHLLPAALEAGFGSYSQLHRAFRAALGCSPRAFFAGVRGGMEAAVEAGDLTASSRTP